MGQQVMILMKPRHRCPWPLGARRQRARRHDRDRVWIGARATILPGAVIEDDVIVASGAVVTGRCLSGGVYGGVPANESATTLP